MKLGIAIPYYKNSEECEVAFKKLLTTLDKQIRNNIYLFIYEDGQESEWLIQRYLYSNQVIVYGDELNMGIAKARNELLDTLIKYQECDWIMFLDSDDMIDCDFIRKMYEVAETASYDMIISRFIMNKKEIIYDKRSNVAGICLRTEFIKGLTFNEDYNISEDALFIEEVYKRNPRIGKIDSNYYYNYGVNPNSLMMRFERSELNLMKE